MDNEKTTVVKPRKIVFNLEQLKHLADNPHQLIKVYEYIKADPTCTTDFAIKLAKQYELYFPKQPAKQPPATK